MEGEGTGTEFGFGYRNEGMDEKGERVGVAQGVRLVSQSKFLSRNNHNATSLDQSKITRERVGAARGDRLQIFHATTTTLRR